MPDGVFVSDFTYGPLEMIQRIVSGGQTGVDRAALDVALTLGISCGGWIAKGRRAEDGPLDAKYPLKETRQADYSERTRKNVVDSDATLVLTRGSPSGGTALTVEVATEQAKPYHIVDLHRGHSPLAALKWIEVIRPSTLNIAGPRESDAPGIYAEAVKFLNNLLSLDRE